MDTSYCSTRPSGTVSGDYVFMHTENKIISHSIIDGVDEAYVSVKDYMDFMLPVDGGIIYCDAGVIYMMTYDGSVTFVFDLKIVANEEHSIRGMADKDRILIYVTYSQNSSMTETDIIYIFTKKMSLLLVMDKMIIDDVILMRNGCIGVTDNEIFTVYDRKGNEKQSAQIAETESFYPLIEVYDGRILATYESLTCLHKMNDLPFVYFRFPDRATINDAFQLLDGRVILTRSGMMHIYKLDGTIDMSIPVIDASYKTLQLSDGKIVIYYDDMIQVYALDGVLQETLKVNEDIDSVQEECTNTLAVTYGLTVAIVGLSH